jgi:hypothetical protein
MRTARLLIATALAAAAVGCGADGDAPPGAAPTMAEHSSVTGPVNPGRTTAAPAPSMPAVPTPGRPSTVGPADPDRPTVTPPPPSADGDRRGDLIRGMRTLHGVIERDGDWVLLRVGSDRWALLGERARALHNGADVFVTGTPAPPPPNCPADKAITVTQVR